MKQHHKAQAILKVCAAAFIALAPLAASAGQQAIGPARNIAQTDRLIVKYKGAAPGVAHAMPAARLALQARAGQQLGATAAVEDRIDEPRAQLVGR